MMVSFAAPLDLDAREFLTRETSVDFVNQDTAGWFCITVRDEDAVVLAVATAEPKTWFDWHFSAAIAEPRAITRRLLRVIFGTLFTRAVRVTAHVEPDNERSVRAVMRLGFVYEGFLRKGLEGSRDVMVFGMLAEDCRWLEKKGGRHGFKSQAA